MNILYLALYSTLLKVSQALPQAKDPSSQRVTLNYSLPFSQSTDTSKFFASSVETRYGKPLITTKDPQWPDWAFRLSEKLYNNQKLKRDTWAYIFADIGIAGIFIPQRYKGRMEFEYGPDAFSVFQDMKMVARNQLNVVARIGYNLAKFPSEPIIEGQATSLDIKYYETKDGGTAIDNTQPSYIMIGYPMSTALCYRYYGNPVPPGYRTDICKDQDSQVADDVKPLNDTQTSQTVETA